MANSTPTEQVVSGTPSMPNPSRRRDKPQLSCNLCRKRKLKCDRGQPCETCIRRGLSLSCTYSTTSERSDRRPPRMMPSSNVQDRIAQLEKLVISLTSTLNTATRTESISSNNSIPHAEIFAAARNSVEPINRTGSSELFQTPSSLSDSFGRISLENAETNYVDAAHWTAILDGISELKDYFDDHPTSQDKQRIASDGPDIDGPELFCGHTRPVTKQDLLEAMPMRSVVDRLVAKCFSSMDLAPIFIHSPTFLKEYEKFWENPQETPVMWIGLLFAMMCTATLYQEPTPADLIPFNSLPSYFKPREPMEVYREKTVQCLILGRYTKGVPYAIETLIFYMHIEYIKSPADLSQVWILMGIILRLALRMGYHRDPSHFLRITPFQGEMRRRTWAVIAQLDAFGSPQVGLPRMISESHSDTAEPRNLLDEDFDESSTSLPQSRPDTFQTEIQFFISKNKLVTVYGMISDFTTSTQLPAYTEIMRLNRMLDDAKEKVPIWLQMREMSKSIMDSPELIIHRIYIDLQYHKAKCVLHRRHQVCAWSDNQYSYSRTACIESALGILEYQTLLDQETQLGGRLHQDRRKVLAVAKPEFLLATTLLCLDLDHHINAKASSGGFEDKSVIDEMDVVMQALKKSYYIWIGSFDSSKEAQKAAKALQIVLGKALGLGTKESTDLGRITANTCHLSKSSPISADIAITTQLNPSFQQSRANLPPDASLMYFSDFLEWDAGVAGESSGFLESSNEEKWDSAYYAQGSSGFSSAFDFPINFDDV